VRSLILLPKIACQKLVADLAVNPRADRLAVIKFISVLRRYVEVLGHIFIEGWSMGVHVGTVFEFVEE